MSVIMSFVSAVRTTFFLMLAVVVLTTTAAPQERPLPSSSLYGAIKRLSTLTSVLYVAAHPDDENTRLLAWLATGKNVPTSYLSITRGDGGQNVLGAELGPALGLIRTHELLAARKLDGAGQFFATAIDFGFSKNPDETFRQWDIDRLTYDVVKILLAERPDVVICRFPKDSMAGHGQHSASAILAERAVEVCRTQYNWQPTRLLFNAYRFGSRSTVREGMFALDVGQYDPLLGMGYGELAGISRSIHRSQGAGTPSTPGVQPEFFATLAGSPPQQSLFDGIDTTWNRVGRPDIGRDIDAVLASFLMTAPEKSVNALLDIRRKILSVQDTFWRSRKLTEIDNIIASCLGLTADVTTNIAMALAGDSVRVTSRVVVRAGRTVSLVDILLPSGETLRGGPCRHDSTFTTETTSLIPATTPVTEPYWLVKDADGAHFQLTDSAFLGKPTTPSALLCRLRFVVGSDTLTRHLPLSYKKLDPLRGDVIEPLRIVPRISVEPLSSVVFATTPTVTLPVRIRAFGHVTNARLSVTRGTALITQTQPFTLRASTDTLITLSLQRNDLPPGGELELRVTDVSGTSYGRTVSTISYDHLPVLQYTRPARVTVVNTNLKITAKRIAYIDGAGDNIPDILRQLGCVVDVVNDETILRTDELLTYDAVVAGIRVINTRKSMKYLLPALHAYVERGGTLVMQYNTLQDMATRDIGPYPMPLANRRVTEEDAAVTITLPEHRLMTYPNRITEQDFSGWVQERGLYFPYEFDARYEAPLSMSDSKEQPLTGALLHLPYGKGRFIYCSLSLFRQLPAGVPGALRLFANLVSAGR